MQTIPRMSSRKRNYVTKEYDLRTHKYSNVKEELLAIRRKAAMMLAVDIDNARKKFLLDDDSLVLNRLEEKVFDVAKTITVFLGGGKKGNADVWQCPEVDSRLIKK